MITKIALGLSSAITALIVIIILQPAHFRIERTTTLNAPVTTVFAQVNDLQNWNSWSPWAKLDPQAKNTFEGPKAGKGAKFSWSGNNEVGEGSMTVVESRPNERVRFRLDFLKPFESTSTAEFSFMPNGDKTRVTWAMYGENNFIGKAIGLFIDCDKMLGAYFDQGLGNLQKIVEKQP